MQYTITEYTYHFDIEVKNAETSLLYKYDKTKYTMVQALNEARRNFSKPVTLKTLEARVTSLERELLTITSHELRG